MKILCSECVYWVEDKTKAYCENDVWLFTDIIKAKLYNPYLFECFDFELR